MLFFSGFPVELHIDAAGLRVARGTQLLLFFALVYALYWRFRRDGQNRVILASSLFFYGWWDWRFLFLLLLTTGIDYSVASRLMRVEDQARRRYVPT